MRLLFEIDSKDYDANAKKIIRPSARAIILRDGKLAVLYSNRRHYCKIPGGGIKEGETPVEAMIREVREEAGLTVIPESVEEFGHVRRIRKSDLGGVFVQDNFYYTCETMDETHEPEYEGDELIEDYTPSFMDLAEAISINESYLAKHPDDTMAERELRVMKLIRSDR